MSQFLSKDCMNSASLNADLKVPVHHPFCAIQAYSPTKTLKGPPFTALYGQLS